MPLIIIALLVAPWLFAILCRKIGKPIIAPRTAGLFGLGVAFLFFALGHFVQTDEMMRLLPPALPFRKELVLATGVLEIVVAAMMFFRRTRRAGATVAFAVLILFFPASIYGALNAVEFGGHALGPVYLLIRFPLQILLLFWTYWFGLRHVKEEPVLVV